MTASNVAGVATSGASGVVPAPARRYW
jgi:hypothetical protein